MKKFLVPAIGMLALAGGIAVAAPQGAKAGADRGGDLTRAQVIAQVDARFARMDANGDGRITKEDRAATRAKFQEARFTRMDSNGDGSIARAEWDASNAKQAEARKDRFEKRAERGGKMHRMGPRMAMRGTDANRDGALTKEEMSTRALARFDRVDANKDGVITAAEREQARAAMKERRRG